jgi:hypothetical protein
MARVQTRERPSRRKKEQEESSDEHLDDWFARRLDAQGIPAKLGGPSTSRILAVVGLGLALLAFLWAVSSVGPSSSGTPTATTTPPATTGTTGGNGSGNGGGGNSLPASGPVTWKNVTVDVLNGFGGNGAAASASTVMRAAGWKVGTTGNASGITKTEVVFLPGYKGEAKVVAKKLKLGAPVPIAQAPGVTPTSTNGVAVVLGPDQLGASGL